jgi:hypothetical protein
VPNSLNIRDSIGVLAKILLRCWLLGFALLLLWAGVVVFGRETVYRLNSNIFGLTEHELDVVFYAGIVFTKTLVLLFFFFPWLALRLTMRSD